MQLRNCGFGDPQILEICSAVSVLAKYGIIAMGLGNELPRQNKGVGRMHPYERLNDRSRRFF